MTLTQEEIISMRQDMLATQLDMRCNISRRSATGEDPGGQPIYDWSDIVTDEPCHYWKEIGIELTGGVNAEVTRERLILQTETDVNVSDRITSIKDIDGAEVVDGSPLEITEVIKQINQTTLALRQVGT